MKRFVEGEDRLQVALLPHCLDDYVTENNPVRVIEPKSGSWGVALTGESAHWAGMESDVSEWVAHPLGEQPEVEEWSTVADTFAGRVHIEWDTTAPVTPLGQLPFFIEYLKQGGLFDGWVADCPLLFTSPNAPRKRDVLGTLLL